PNGKGFHHELLWRQRERTGIDLLRGIENELGALRHIASRVAHRRIDLQRNVDVVDDDSIALRAEAGIQRPIDMTWITNIHIGVDNRDPFHGGYVGNGAADAL